jgi:hypothetical protein
MDYLSTDYLSDDVYDDSFDLGMEGLSVISDWHSVSLDRRHYLRPEEKDENDKKSSAVRSAEFGKKAARELQEKFKNYSRSSSFIGQVASESFEEGYEAAIAAVGMDTDDPVYAYEMTDEQIKKKVDLMARNENKHGEAPSKVPPLERIGLSKARRNDLMQGVVRSNKAAMRGDVAKTREYAGKAFARNFNHADRVAGEYGAERGLIKGGRDINATTYQVSRDAEHYAKKYSKRGFLGTVASESFNEGYLQALEDYGYFE